MQLPSFGPIVRMQWAKGTDLPAGEFSPIILAGAQENMDKENVINRLNPGTCWNKLTKYVNLAREVNP